MLICSALTLAVGLFIEQETRVGNWLDFVTIVIVPIGAVLGAISIYYVLGWPKIRQELELGREKPLHRAFGIAGKYIYVPSPSWFWCWALSMEASTDSQI